jgi:hypothetical protein
MSGPRICSICQTQNEPEAARCAQCGQPLESDTTIWTAIALADVAVEPELPIEPVADGLALYVVGAHDREPIRCSGQTTLILGRSSQAAPLAERLIDLSRFEAYALGVSRQHARITPNDRGYAIEDLGSSNGTWLNGNRLEARQLYQLRGGDHIQLGELLIFVYFGDSR